ncbi:actin-1-like [Eleutherodactylus coqui]|uniref:actin-1-like n=1 Tax=Eleutherodactylus coqui TaxID=57060 RepID=UPI0034622667
MAEFHPAVVIDNGSGLLKIGTSGNKEPCFIYHNIIGRPKAKPVMIGAGQKDYFVGEEAQRRRGVLSLKYPVERGVITSWEDMELIWKHSYYCHLKINPSERPALITEPPLNPLSNRKNMAQVFFEKFDVPAIYVATQGVLALYCAGKVTGCVLDIGHGVTHSVPVYEGYCLPHAVLRLDLAGHDLTEYLMRLLRERGVFSVSTAETEIVKDIKEKLCYVAEDIDAELRKKLQEVEDEYKLPDGNVIKVHNQRFRCPEALFAPDNIGIEAPGIDTLLFHTITKSDIDLRRTLYSNILLSGGSSLFNGIDLRLTKELRSMVPADCHVKVSAPPDPMLAAWMGGSIVSSLSAFQQMWVTKSEYQEIGPNIVRRKCF